MHRRPSKCVQVGDGEAAVARAAGDDHRAGAHGLAVGQVDAEARPVPLARRAGLVGDGHLDAELQRLVVGRRHQRHAGDAGGKAEIVLDPRRGAGLAAEGPAVQRQDRQALGAA